MLGGVKERVGKGEKKKKNWAEENEISREEIRTVLKMIKDGKVAGINKVPGKVWKYGGEKIEEWKKWKFCNRIWKGKGA